jgi:lipopolysaccharide export system protein LptA
MLKQAGAALGLVLACAAPAWGQLNNSSAPIDLTADELEVINDDCVAIWRGSAEALQDNARLRADVLKIYNEKGPAKAGSTNPSCGSVDRMEANGSVYYVTPQQRVRGDAAVYDSASDTITFTGDVVAVQGKNVLRGAKLVVNTKTNYAQMQTNSKGRNSPNRVRGVFYPKDKSPTDSKTAQ